MSFHEAVFTSAGTTNRSGCNRRSRRKLQIRGRQKRLADSGVAGVWCEYLVQQANGLLMPVRGSGAHEQRPVEHFVSLPVLGKRTNHLQRPVGLVCRHAHSVPSARRKKQANIRRGLLSRTT